MFGFGPTEEWPGIAKQVEEMGELGQVLGKLMMVHGSDTHWSGPLRPMLVDELADVLAISTFVKKHCLTDTERRRLIRRAVEKELKFEAWHRGEE